MSHEKKGSLSGLEFRVLSKELGSLAGSYVSNIYSIGENQLLRLRSPTDSDGASVESSLVLAPKQGVWETEKPARGKTTEFTTALRSYLLRAKLVSVAQEDLDRVLSFRFEGKGPESQLSLIIELMPPGNLILTQGDRIILVLRETKTEARKLAQGARYLPPPQTRGSIESLTPERVEETLAKEKTLGRALGRGLSIPRRYVDEILSRVSRGQDDAVTGSKEEVKEVTAAVDELLRELGHPSPSLVSSGGTVEVMAIRPKAADVLKTAARLSPLLDELYFSDLLTQEEEQASRAAPEGGESAVGAHERRIREFSATMADLEAKKAALGKLSAELRKLASAVKAAPDVDQSVEVAKSSKLLPKDLESSLVKLAGKGQASVASAIFDRAKRAEQEIAQAEDAIGTLRAKVKKESGREVTARVKTVQLSRAKKEWFEKFRWFYTTEGKLAIGGRDAQSNTLLVRRHLDDGDTVFHADLFGSPFFLLKGGQAQTPAEEKEVAKATVTFSSAWKTGLGSADAYWVSPEQVSNAGPSGEYLAHGSFAIKGKKNFVTKLPVELAVGVDEKGRVLSGPEECVMKLAVAHVTLIPSREKPSDTAKKVLYELRGYTGDAPIGVDDVLRMLPAGGGKIVRRRVDKRPAEGAQPVTRAP